MPQASRTQTEHQMSVETILGPDKMLMSAMHGTEALGRLFQFDLECFTEGGQPANAKDMLGTNVTIRLLTAQKTTRYFNGFVAKFALVNVIQNKAATINYSYHLTLVPWLWFLTRGAGCRIFQDKTVPDIIKSVFKDRGYTDVKDQLTETFRTWEYCVQYRETDFNFVSRLMENEGIYYYFEHENGKHTLVLCDAPTAHKKTTNYETLKFDQPDATEDQDAYAFDWVHGNEMLTSSCALMDFNPLQPKTDLYNSVAAQNSESTGMLEFYDYPGTYTTPDEGRFYARTRMEEQEAQYVIGHASTSARGLGVGATFELDGHPVVAQADYLVTAASYALNNEQMNAGGGAGGKRSAANAGGGSGAGTAAGAAGATKPEPPFEAKITVMPAKVPFRPQRSTRKPTVRGPQTAIVVGKAGEEIWTDKYGRVKVKFPWDPTDTVDETASCWIRVSQNWAGKNWGVFFAPRIGQEVVVDFLEGDPDRPIITGRVYNGENVPPYDLPTMQTISTIKSNSSKGGQGFNEFRFEDKKGEEQIFIHGEKNMDIRVKNDRFENILNDRHLVVEKDKFEHVKNKKHVLVDVDLMEHIKNDVHTTIDGKETRAVTGTQSLKVTGDVTEEFGGKHSEVTSSDYFLKADNIVIEGKTTVTIKVGSQYLAIAADGIKLGTTGTFDIEATGATTIKTQADLACKAPSGAFNVTAATVSIAADGTAEFKGNGPATVSSSAILTVKGSMVKIN